METGQDIRGVVLQGEPEWRSASVAQLAEALAKAQGKIRNAAKDSTNPHFRSKYADLASVWDACREALSENGLSVTQHPRMEFRGEPEVVKVPTRNDGERYVVKCIMLVSVATRLLHSSGEWMESTLQAILPGADPQTVGSALTYLRRYGLAAMVGVAPDEDDSDDDGERATGREHDQRERPRFDRPAPAARPQPRATVAPASQPRVEVPEGASADNIIVAHVVAREGQKHPRTERPYRLRKVTLASGAAAHYFEHERPGMAENLDRWMKEGAPVEVATEQVPTANGQLTMLVEARLLATAAEVEAATTEAEPDDSAALEEQAQFLASELPATTAAPAALRVLPPIGGPRAVEMTDDDIPF